METPPTRTSEPTETLLDMGAPAPLVIAHRGASGDAPDNSLPAFEAAIAEGADLVELDVRRTADGQLIALHPARRRGTAVGRLTYDDLVRRSRHRPPALEEVLTLCSGRVAVDVELKEPGYEETAIKLVERHLDPPRAVVTSFHTAIVERVKSLRPALRCGLILGFGRLRASHAGLHRTILEPARQCGADFLVAHQLLVGLRPHSKRQRRRSAPFLTAAGAAGLPVAVWTVNGVERLRHFVAEPGVAAIITDLPAVAVELRRRGSRLPHERC